MLPEVRARGGGLMAEMHICDRCGKPTPNYSKYITGTVCGRDGYSVCDDCRSKERRERAWENEQLCKDEITCPWCGYVDTDSWEFEVEYDDAYECPSCGKPFILERIIYITYTSKCMVIDIMYMSKRRVNDMPEGWCGDDD